MNRLMVNPTPHSTQTPRNWRVLAPSGKRAPATRISSQEAANTPTALPATVPGLLVGLHYAVQVLRPRWGYGSDMGGRHSPWILSGLAVLGVGGFGAAL